MPRLDNLMENQTVKGTTFKFSTTKLQNLGATEYTLITLAVDRSGSVTAFQADLEKALMEIVGACKYSPRADNLMIRFVSFAGNVQEEHGFKLLSECNPDDYKGILSCGGNTALFDSAYSSLEVLIAESKRLSDAEYTSNAILFVITDGDDNSSSFGAGEVKKSMAKAMKNETMESLVSVLVGVGTDPGTSKYLADFKDQAGFTQYVNVGEANAKNLAKLAQFVSKSISAQSQSLNSGAAAPSLTF